MLTRLGPCIVAGILAAAAPGVRADAFDEQALRLNVASLLNAWPALLAPGEAEQLRGASASGLYKTASRLLLSKVLVEIAINAEGRLTARRTDKMMDTMLCRQYSKWLLHIRNAGYVTAPLEVRIASRPGSDAIKVRMLNDKLTGAADEYRIIEVSPETADTTEVTLLFSAGEGSADLAFRAEVPIIISCQIS